MDEALRTKPLQTVIYSLVQLAEFVLADNALTDPRLQQHDVAKESETACSPRFDLVSCQSCLFIESLI